MGASVAVLGKKNNSMIKDTLDKNGISVSCAKTVKDICKRENYNMSIEITVRRVSHL